MNQTVLNIITSLITGGVITTVIIAISERRKRKAEADNLIVEGAKALLVPLTERIETLENQRRIDREKIDGLETEREAQRAQIRTLQAQGREDRAIIDDLQKQSKQKDQKIAELQDGVVSRDVRITDLESEVAVLREQVKALGGVPKRKTGELRSPATGAA